MSPIGYVINGTSFDNDNPIPPWELAHIYMIYIEARGPVYKHRWISNPSLIDNYRGTPII